MDLITGNALIFYCSNSWKLEPKINGPKVRGRNEFEEERKFVWGCVPFRFARNCKFKSAYISLQSHMNNPSATSQDGHVLTSSAAGNESASQVWYQVHFQYPGN